MFIISVCIVFSTMIQAQRVQLISALGADSTIYSKLVFDKSLDIQHVEWIKPLKKESLEDYCDRLIILNNINSEDIIIGTSFGGLVATVISKKIHPKKTILISSISRQDEKPPKFKFLQVFRFHKIIPKSLLDKPGLLIWYCFGKVTEYEKIFLTRMFENNDVDLVSWCIDQIMKYDNRTDPPDLVKINGSHDKTFHIRNIDTDYKLSGTHLMVYNMADTISYILNNILLKEEKTVAGKE